MGSIFERNKMFLFLSGWFLRCFSVVVVLCCFLSVYVCLLLFIYGMLYVVALVSYYLRKKKTGNLLQHLYHFKLCGWG